MDKIQDLLKQQFHERVVEESLPRIFQCLDILSHKEIWYKHNANTNSIGNLVLHLCGNVKQYIISGIGGQADTRERDIEFQDVHTYNAQDLKEKISGVLLEADAIVSKMPEELFVQKKSIQGFDHNYVSILVHVIEHLSYHVGQITFYTKYVKDVDTGYYSGLDLNITQ